MLSQNIVLSGGTTMIKDFQKRLQRDVKKIVDARMDASVARHGEDVKVGISSFYTMFCHMPTNG